MQRNDETAAHPAEGFGAAAFAVPGAPRPVYVGPVETDRGRVFGIRAADGELLAIAASRDLAFAIARRHDLDPADVH